MHRAVTGRVRRLIDRAVAGKVVIICRGIQMESREGKKSVSNANEQHGTKMK